MKSIILFLCGILFAITILACLPVQAKTLKKVKNSNHFTAIVRCYTNGKLMYAGKGKDVAFDDAIFAFTEIPSNMIVITNAECIAKIY